MVSARKALESLYDGRMTVTEHRRITLPNHTTSFRDEVVLNDQPCRLSFAVSPITGGGDVATVTQTVKLFYAPEIQIAPGSKITVTQNGKTVAYKQSGTEAVYETHREVMLDLFERWA